MKLTTRNFDIFKETELITDVQSQLTDYCEIKNINRGEFHDIYVGAYKTKDRVITVFYVPNKQFLFMAWDMLILNIIKEGEETYETLTFNDSAMDSKPISKDTMMTRQVLFDLDKNEAGEEGHLNLTYISFAGNDQDLRKLCLDKLDNTWNLPNADSKGF